MCSAGSGFSNELITRSEESYVVCVCVCVCVCELETSTVSQPRSQWGSCAIYKWARCLLGRHDHACCPSVGLRSNFLCSAVTGSLGCPQQHGQFHRTAVTEKSGQVVPPPRAAQFEARKNEGVKWDGVRRKQILYCQRWVDFAFLIKYKKIEKKNDGDFIKSHYFC